MPLSKMSYVLCTTTDIKKERLKGVNLNQFLPIHLQSKIDKVLV